MTNSKYKAEFLSWLSCINNKRNATAVSISEFKYAKCRTRQLKDQNLFPSIIEDDLQLQHINLNEPMPILYWMLRDQRVQDNWAFLFAQRLALKFKVPLRVVFCLVPQYQTPTLRHFKFMVDGLKEVETECQNLNIPFELLSIPETTVAVGQIKKRTWDQANNTKPTRSDEFCQDQVSQLITDVVKRRNIGCVVTDFFPLREYMSWYKAVAEDLPERIPFCQVDAHNVVPVWYASDKLEYAARTIRPKITEKSRTLLTEFPPLIKHPYQEKSCGTLSLTNNWQEIEQTFTGDLTVQPVAWATPGTTAAFHTLYTFIGDRLSKFDEFRNNPTKDAISNLSPWFHFGQISTQRALLEVKALSHKHHKPVEIFVEEALVRRELADNFCYYNPNYDNIDGAYKWARETLLAHSHDKRNVSYTEEQMKNAETKDDLWNASQRQLTRTGKLHGYLRMYWAKKILEWHSDGPIAALKFALWLNDHYSLDGYDPNGFTGVMWSICGIHDQGWMERPIIGKIRAMNYKGCARKFSIPEYVSKYKK